MVDRYNIDVANSIGHGAFGKIFRCSITPNFHEYLRLSGLQMPFDTSTKLFAVKVQSYDSLFQGQLHLLREIDVLMRTKNYPGTVEMFDFYLSDETKQAYLILRMAEGSLDTFIRQKTDPFKRIEYLPFFNTQMLIHLGYLKHNSIAHRDIKPQNILLESAPTIFGWTIDKSYVDPHTKSRFFSIENIRIQESNDSPIKQLCKHFLPMGQNCNCFNSEGEDCTPTSVVFLTDKTADISQPEYSAAKQVSARTEKLKQTISSPAVAAVAARVGSCPSRNLFDSRDDTMDEDEIEEVIAHRGEQQRESVLPIHLQTDTKIRNQQKSVPFAFLCDFGLSKHMNKTHHSPYIVTPNFRSPELFDTISFTRDDDDNNLTQDELFAAKDALKKNNLRSSLLLSTQASTNSPSSSDPNDVSLRCEDDLAYNESIDVWGLGCTLAQLVTGKPLFPGKNLQSVYTTIKDLLSGSSITQLPHQVQRNQDLFQLDEERGFVNAFGEESEEENQWQSPPSGIMWINSVNKRAERIRQRIFLQLVSANASTAQKVCDLLGNEFFDMLARMLDPNPQTRPSAEELLSHQFVEPYVQPTLALIFTIASERPQKIAPMLQFSKRSDHHWWAFQYGLRAGSFDKNQLQAAEFSRERVELWKFRRLVFTYMLDIVRQTKCRYQTLFSALYHFDRCVANFPRAEVRETLLCKSNYYLLAACCIYLVIRYYERIYISIDALQNHLGLNADSQRIEKCMALFLSTISGQITLPSPWHFVLLCFSDLLALRQKEFGSIRSYKIALLAIFQSRKQMVIKRLRKTAAFQTTKEKEREQYFSALKLTAASNNSLFAESLRADARTPKNIYTSHFKKHCSRLLYFIMADLGIPYIAYNNRALGTIVFKRCLFNALFLDSFERLQLRHDNSTSSRSTITLVKARYN